MHQELLQSIVNALVKGDGRDDLFILKSKN